MQLWKHGWERLTGRWHPCARDFVKLNELTEEKTQLETQLRKNGSLDVSGRTCGKKYFNKMHKKGCKTFLKISRI